MIKHACATDYRGYGGVLRMCPVIVHLIARGEGGDRLMIPPRPPSDTASVRA